MRFIKLTLFGKTDTSIWVNVDTIATLLPKYRVGESDKTVGTSIEHIGNIEDTPVKESPEEILKMIRESEKE